MGFRNTGRTTIGPISVNYAASGRPSSVSIGLGPAPLPPVVAAR